eukprot:PhF_6_TR26328/c0_g1_i1/m.37859
MLRTFQRRCIALCGFSGPILPTITFRCVQSLDDKRFLSLYLDLDITCKSTELKNVCWINNRELLDSMMWMAEVAKMSPYVIVPDSNTWGVVCRHIIKVVEEMPPLSVVMCRRPGEGAERSIPMKPLAEAMCCLLTLDEKMSTWYLHFPAPKETKSYHVGEECRVANDIRTMVAGDNVFLFVAGTTAVSFSSMALLHSLLEIRYKGFVGIIPLLNHTSPLETPSAVWQSYMKNKSMEDKMFQVDVLRHAIRSAHSILHGPKPFFGVCPETCTYTA